MVHRCGLRIFREKGDGFEIRPLQGYEIRPRWEEWGRKRGRGQILNLSPLWVQQVSLGTDFKSVPIPSGRLLHLHKPTFVAMCDLVQAI